MFNTIVGAGAASRYSSSSGSDQKMRLLAAPAPQHWCVSIKYRSFDTQCVSIKYRSFDTQCVSIKYKYPGTQCVCIKYRYP
jgi:hypothetical protein